MRAVLPVGLVSTLWHRKRRLQTNGTTRFCPWVKVGYSRQIAPVGDRRGTGEMRVRCVFGRVCDTGGIEYRQCRQPGVDTRMPRKTSVIREMVSLETLTPSTSATWAAISPVVRPFALSDNTVSLTPVSRRCRFFTICGSNVEPVSLGTSICTGPISVSTVFVRVPLREFPLPRPDTACFSYP